MTVADAFYFVPDYGQFCSCSSLPFNTCATVHHGSLSQSKESTFLSAGGLCVHVHVRDDRRGVGLHHRLEHHPRAPAGHGVSGARLQWLVRRLVRRRHQVSDARDLINTHAQKTLDLDVGKSVGFFRCGKPCAPGEFIQGKIHLFGEHCSSGFCAEDMYRSQSKFCDDSSCGARTIRGLSVFLWRWLCSQYSAKLMFLSVARFCSFVQFECIVLYLQTFQICELKNKS